MMFKNYELRGLASKQSVSIRADPKFILGEAGASMAEAGTAVIFPRLVYQWPDNFKMYK